MPDIRSARHRAARGRFPRRASGRPADESSSARTRGDRALDVPRVGVPYRPSAGTNRSATGFSVLRSDANPAINFSQVIRNYRRVHCVERHPKFPGVKPRPKLRRRDQLHTDRVARNGRMALADVDAIPMNPLDDQHPPARRSAPAPRRYSLSLLLACRQWPTLHRRRSGAGAAPEPLKFGDIFRDVQRPGRLGVDRPPCSPWPGKCASSATLSNRKVRARRRRCCTGVAAHGR